jgi:hypothetical protein
MDDSNFKTDLSNEGLLANHLNGIYKQLFHSPELSIERADNLDLQHQGVDLILTKGNVKYNVDEKAQLDYLNTSLPTFAFEISYLKKHIWHKGWLFDSNKITDIYFLITSIYTKEGCDLGDGLMKIKITGVYRKELIKLLEGRGVTESYLFDMEKDIREKNIHGKVAIKGLNPHTEGALYISKNNKNEQPINLVLKLKFLIGKKTGKLLFKL